VTINGSVSIATYFILNKKDRAGKAYVRPFQAVLEEMKRQDTEAAKMKQSSSLKGGNIQNPLPPPPPPVAAAPPPPPPAKENGVVQPPPPAPAPVHQNDPRLMRTESLEIPVPVKMHRNEDLASNLIQNPLLKTKINERQPMEAPEMMGGEYDSPKSYNTQLQRSRACELL
jgi:hypothetical protein